MSKKKTVFLTFLRCLYLEKAFKSYSGTADIYIYFIERGICLLKNEGKLGFITSGTFARTNFAAPFRDWLPSQAQFEKVINFGENQPFEDAEMVYPTISVLKKNTSSVKFNTLFMRGTIPKSIDAELFENGEECSSSLLQRPQWIFQSEKVHSIAERLFDSGTPLGASPNFRIFYGVKTGLNEVFIIDSQTRQELINKDPSCEALIKHMYSGEDLLPWYQKESDKWLIFSRRGVDIDSYPSIKEYLNQFRERLEPKPSSWRGKWNGRKAGAYKWYEIQDSVDYFQAFEQKKLFWPDIAKLPRFSLNETGSYLNNTGYVLTIKSPWILAILQSRVIWFCISQIATPLRLRGGLWQFRCVNQFMTRLPIPKIHKNDKDFLSRLAMSASEIAQKRYELQKLIRHRIRSDLGGGNTKLNNKLASWWTIDFPTFRAEIKKTFKTKIPVDERGEWEKALINWRFKHDDLTSKLIDVENQINERAYKYYKLSKVDINLIEEHMKKIMIHYPFGYT